MRIGQGIQRLRKPWLFSFASPRFRSLSPSIGLSPRRVESSLIMAYWWVSQGQTFPIESAGKYLWAPGPDSANLYHWATMDNVRRGDVIFAYYRQAISAIAIATGGVHIAPRPAGYSVKAWEGLGRRVPAEYTSLPVPVTLSELRAETLDALIVFHGPLNKNRTGNQGYLFPVSDSAGHGIVKAIEAKNQEGLVEIALQRALTKDSAEMSVDTDEVIQFKRSVSSAARINLIFYGLQCSRDAISQTDTHTAAY